MIFSPTNCARRRVEQNFCAWLHRLVAQVVEHLADLLADLRPPWLTGEQDILAEACQGLGQ